MMKKAIMLCGLLLSVLLMQAQFTKARLQASGLTCAMCTKAINTSLQKLPFVQSVQADIQQSEFAIVFKPGAEVQPDALKKAVEDAGFSVARLKLSGNFDGVAVAPDSHVTIGTQVYHFVGVPVQTLQGEKEIRMIDKSFLTDKEFKKWSASTKMDCIKTGKAAACCQKEGVAAHTRIFHVTI